MNTLDLFAGPGGWDHAARELGINPLGIEWDEAACETREAAGLRTVRGDVAALDPLDFDPIDLLIASPPCQAWSVAGSGGGEHDRAAVHRLSDDLAAGRAPTLKADWADERSALVLEPLRWALTLRPRFIAFEQVPPVLSYWRHLAQTLETIGYSAWSGNLYAEEYGVPQTRKRAILLASLEGEVAPPTPTHRRYRKGEAGTLELDLDDRLPWVSMAEALGWAEDSLVGFPRRADTPSNKAGGRTVELGGTDYRARDLRRADEPAAALTEKARSWGRWKLQATNDRPNAARRALDEPAPTIAFGKDRPRWTYERPATTIAGDPRVFAPGGHIAHDGRDNSKMIGRSEQAIRVELEEVSILQGFPPDYPWRGSRTKRFQQIGNAVPPPLAKAILTALIGAKVPV